MSRPRVCVALLLAVACVRAVMPLPDGPFIDSARKGLWILIGTATIAIALNVPRMVAGVREVLEASAENRAALAPGAR